MELMQISPSFHRIFSTSRLITTESVTMATFEFSVPRLVLAGGFAVAVATAPMVAVLATPAPAASTVSACPAGEEEDLYTGSCLPHTVPNSPSTSPFSTNPGNPDLPTIGGIPCTGHDTGKCIGLAENSSGYVAPQATFGQ